MPISPYKVKFNMGENATDSNPPIEAGQILLDKAEDKQCLFVDVDDSTRLQVKDPTKMDKWGEVSISEVPFQGVSILLKDIVVNDPDPLSHGYFAQQTLIGTSIINESNQTAPNATLQIMSMGDPNDAENYFNTISMQSAGTHEEVHYRGRISLSDMGMDMLDLRVESTSGDSYDDTCARLVLNAGGFIEVESSSSVNPAGISIRGIRDVSRDTDAANKKYVDDQVLSVQTTWIDW